ncbi:MAG: Cupin 2, conserved barrel domain protein [Clostridiales bacterium]|jgi:quercetin dioxygenase-like cupin family protein|nr:Cupin 2, conserved barrel domain protein [Clostridiales bacterium]
MYYTYDAKNSISVPSPYKRYITPIFMGDDKEISETNFSVHMTEWEPGCKIDMHMHPSGMEAMYCISGKGIASVNGKSYEFIPGSMIVAPPTVEHQIVNTGDEMLRVFCVFSPPVTGKSLRERALEAINEAESLNIKGGK